MQQSTSKMLGRLASVKSVSEVTDLDAPEIMDIPQLKPAVNQQNEMQNKLINALGMSHSKQLSPTDRS